MKDGKVIKVDANSTEFWEDTRILTLYNGVATVGKFYMDNILGYVNSDYVVEKED
jgi:hypothetical protein